MNALFTEIERAIAETTDAETERYETGGQPKKSQKPIGVIHDLEVRKLFVATRRMQLMSQFKNIEAQLHGREELSAESQRLAMIADAMRELSWIAACDSLGAWGNTEHHGYGLCAGWMLVYEMQARSPLAHLLELGGRE